MKKQIKQNIALSSITSVLLTALTILYIFDLYTPNKFMIASILVILDLAILNGIFKDIREVNGR